MITMDRLRAVLHYDPETGIFTWKQRLSNRVHIGDIAGALDHDQYVIIGIDGVTYRAHRLAFLYMNGVMPSDCIDHINGEVGDNSWSNLREAGDGINQENKRRPQSSSSTGLLGVVPKRGRFAAYIGVKKKSFYLGTFDTPEEAHERYLQEKRARHAGCTI